MIEELLTRIPAQEFLNKYPSDRWKEIIADVIEIGILNLKNSFGTDEFSRSDIKSVLNDLRHYTPGSQDFPTYTRYQNEQYRKTQGRGYFDPKTNTIKIKREVPLYNGLYNNPDYYNTS